MSDYHKLYLKDGEGDCPRVSDRVFKLAALAVILGYSRKGANLTQNCHKSNYRPHRIPYVLGGWNWSGVPLIFPHPPPCPAVWHHRLCQDAVQLPGMCPAAQQTWSP